jgi:hypothetical protein
VYCVWVKRTSFILVLTGSPEEVKRAIVVGSDGKAKCNSGKTAFDYAEENKHIKNTDAYWLLNDAQY